MNKKQFLFLTIMTLIIICTINVCIGLLLPVETSLQQAMHIVLPLCFGLLAGIIISIITIVFENTRKDK